MNATRRTVVALIVGLIVPLPLRGEGKPLVICVVPASMPRSHKTPKGKPLGLDCAVIELVAKELGRPLEFHWCANATCSWHCLTEKRCQVVVGQPFQSESVREVGWSVPYAGAQFGLVTPRNVKGVRSLADLAGKRVGIAAGTVPLSADDHQVVRFASREEVLQQFRKSKLDAAFLDADFAAWYLHEHRDLELKSVPGFTPREHWNMAFAVRSGDAALLVDINRALARLAENDEIRKAYAVLGVPWRAPFTGTGRRRPPVDTWKKIQERGTLIISMDPANLPYTDKGERPGFEVELAQALAKGLGLKLKIDWLDVLRETAVGELLEGDCDLAMGAAVDPNAVDDEEELAGKVIYSRPYYGTGYLLVEREAGPHVKSLADLKGEKSRRLGAEAGTYADYRLRQRGLLRRIYRSQVAVLKEVQGGDIDHAYVWANVGWTLNATPDFKLRIVPGYVPEDRWNIAVALRAGDEELKRRVDVVLDKLVKDGTVAAALKKYHVPFFKPFAEEKKQTSTDEVVRHPVADRGLEPNLSRRQSSKNPYEGLARVQSAGVLVVGLDHNNLPFSAVHPRPAGLDYEIAALLAKELGVSLRVYWAYSSHDSYPSKLATKKLCDVMLGVMPDDRFGRRVQFTRPYYLAGYDFVVPAQGGAQSSEDLKQVSLEAGVRVRGLEELEVKTADNLEAILAGVVSGKETAGYVISARSHWLAHQRWPGKLRFLPGAASDRFAICAAVRKSDDTLKVALENAFEKLARDGQLAKVFERWHVPLVAPMKEKQSGARK